MSTRIALPESLVQEIVPEARVLSIDFYLDGTLAEMVKEYSPPTAPVQQPSTDAKTRIERLFSHD